VKVVAMNKQGHRFGTTTLLEKLSKLGNPLMKIDGLIDWEMFRTPIERAIHKDMSRGGHPPYDVILMFKITILQQVVRAVRYGS
jgi:hypothetical protein